MIIRAKTFKDWMKSNFKKSEMRDITDHGVDGGFLGLTYYCDTSKLYDKFHKEIWDALFEDSEDLGYKNIFSFIASFNRNEASNDVQFKNLLVWYLAEKIAREEIG